MTDLRDWFDLMWRTSEQDFKRRREAIALVQELAGDAKADLFLCCEGGKVYVIMRGQTTGATVRFVREDSHTPPGA